jgi:5-(carboxyamino)imidazole ribonucleotide synthase
MLTDSSPSDQSSPQRVNTIGIIGGGQLAWMMAAAAVKLDRQLIIQTPNTTDPAVAIASAVMFAEVDDVIATQDLAQKCDVITFENEFVDLVALAPLVPQGAVFRPSLTTLQPLLDKYNQRCYLQSQNLPTPTFASPAPAIIPSLPTVLKTRRMGYDGQGTFIVKTLAEYQTIVDRVGAENLIQETYIPFERELAIMVARSPQGEIVCYPIVETQQRHQVCHAVIAPAVIGPDLASEIDRIARAIVTGLDGVGIFGIEFFLTHTGEIFVNEIAPRTHNSGHYSLDACVTSQFEQQLRAVCGLPLGSAQLNCVSAIMVNLLGYETSDSDYANQRQALAAIPQAHVHWYGKTARPGRKLGHVTVCSECSEDDSPSWVTAQLAAIGAIWPDPSGEKPYG